MRCVATWRPFVVTITLTLIVNVARAGVTVVVPATSGEELCDLTRGGADLVKGLATDPASVDRIRKAIQARGLYGIATVSLLRSGKQLPFADNLVNAVHVNLDALPTLAADEAMRILAPGGVLTSIENGRSLKRVKPRPAAMDDWTHFDYDAAGTGVSHDRLVGPPTNIQWRCEAQEYIGLGGNPAAYRPYTGFRVMNGRAFALYGTGQIGDKGAKNAPAMLVARDAFNGTPIWTIPAYSAGSGTPQEYQFVAGGDRVFTYLSENGPLVALDAATGKVAVTYEKAAKIPSRASKVAAGYVMFRYADGLLVQTDRTRLIALDAATGEVKWIHEEKSDYLCFPRVVAADHRVYVQAVESGAEKIQGRWANLKTTALLCFDLRTGRPVWRSEDLAGANFGQSIVSGDKVFLFNPGGIGASDKWGKNNPGGNVTCLNAADGKLLWSTPKKFTWGYNLLVRDGQPYFATPDTLNAVNPTDGTIDAFWNAPFNNRCNRTSATDQWVIMGLGIFVSSDRVASVRGIARSGCAQGAFPANGLTYYTPNTCTCFTMLRGHLALSCEPTGAPLPDDQRLAAGGPGADAGYAGKPTALDTPVSCEWAVQVNRGATESPAVRSADGRRFYVAVTHEHRLECRQYGNVAWSFTAGGRISQPPVLTPDGQVIFGAHDGHAYCLDAVTGAPTWDFLAAPVERDIVSHGQLESAYPVYNVVTFEGNACFTAGLHPEVGGGIHAWGVSLRTGKVAWHKTFKRSDVLAKPGTKIAPNRVMNSPLTVEDGKLAITGLTFTPAEDDAAIQQRIDTQSVGDKLRNAGWSVRGTPVQNR